MNRVARPTATLLGLALLFSTAIPPATAQQPSGTIYRLFGEIPLASLAQLEEVSEALKLSDDQKTTIAKLNAELNAARMEEFRNAQGDFDAMRVKTIELYAAHHAKVAEVLDEAQQKRGEQVYVQVNGPTALLSAPIADKLQLDEEQRKKLAAASVDHWYDTFDSFEDMQSMSNEERAALVDELIASRDISLLAAITKEQQETFAKLRGEEVNVDLDKLPMPGPGQ